MGMSGSVTSGRSSERSQKTSDCRARTIVVLPLPRLPHRKTPNVGDSVSVSHFAMSWRWCIYAESAWNWR